ncbi:hypothetical protein C7N43_38720 [Sphingobacteriales bacterium UPWRP_1]|nr:hypothetical protein C7N43_38720 [Sphingobacteriales bacterium UPWRP_1]
MPYANLSPSFDAATLTLALADIAQIKARMPFLINLTPNEKKSFLRLGRSNRAFIEQCLNHINNNPILQLPFIDIPEWQNDWEVFKRLDNLHREIQSLEEAVNDTRLALLKECMIQALAFYRGAKSAALQNVPGTDSIVQDLHAFFPASGSKRQPAEPASEE